MNAHSFRSLFGRQNVVPFTAFCSLIIVVVFGLTAGVAQSSATASGGSGSGAQKPPFMPSEDLSKEFNDDDLKVKDEKARGKWGYTTLLDMKQKNDPSLPAYVNGIQLLSGGGKYQGITKIKRVQVKNRSPQTIVSVQVRFEVTYFDKPEKILLEDTFPLVNVSIAPNVSEVVEVQTLYPAKMLKALAKNGELYGHFGLRMSVQEIRFADGSFWRRPEPLASLKSPYHDNSPSYRFPPIAFIALNVFPPLRSPANNQINMTPCYLKPRLAASAFALVPFQTTTCYDNSGPFIDGDGRKNCGSPAPNLTCYAACNAEGHCETWESDDPCIAPTPTPTPTPEPETCSCESGLKPNPSCGQCTTLT